MVKIWGACMALRHRIYQSYVYIISHYYWVLLAFLIWQTFLVTELSKYYQFSGGQTWYAVLVASLCVCDSLVSHRWMDGWPLPLSFFFSCLPFIALIIKE